MTDRLRITPWSVHVTLPQGLAADALRQRLSVMERELNHLKTAVADMKSTLARKDVRALGSGLLNSRNWTLSVAFSHCYVQKLLGMGAPMSSGMANTASPFPDLQLDVLFGRAVKAGIEDGKRDSSLQGAVAGPSIHPISITSVLIGG